MNYGIWQLRTFVATVCDPSVFDRATERAAFEEMLETPGLKVLRGPRNCGKSTLIRSALLRHPGTVRIDLREWDGKDSEELAKALIKGVDDLETQINQMYLLYQLLEDPTTKPSFTSPSMDSFSIAMDKLKKLMEAPHYGFWFSRRSPPVIWIDHANDIVNPKEVDGDGHNFDTLRSVFQMAKTSNFVFLLTVTDPSPAAFAANLFVYDDFYLGFMSEPDVRRYCKTILNPKYGDVTDLAPICGGDVAALTSAARRGFVTGLAIKEEVAKRELLSLPTEQRRAAVALIKRLSKCRAVPWEELDATTKLLTEGQRSLFVRREIHPRQSPDLDPWAKEHKLKLSEFVVTAAHPTLQYIFEQPGSIQFNDEVTKTELFTQPKSGEGLFGVLRSRTPAHQFMSIIRP